MVKYCLGKLPIAFTTAATRLAGTAKTGKQNTRPV